MRGSNREKAEARENQEATEREIVIGETITVNL